MQKRKLECLSHDCYSTASSVAETTKISSKNSINSHRDKVFPNKCVYNYGKF